MSKLNNKILNAELAVAENTTIKLSDFADKNIVIYFYPKDNTPGCTKESIAFRDHLHDFEKANTVIIGVSRDSLKSHDKFKTKYELPFYLVSDPDEVLCQYFDVIKSKSMYGKTFLGVERSTFLINTQSDIAQEWRKVKVAGHVEAVLEAAQTLV